MHEVLASKGLDDMPLQGNAFETGEGRDIRRNALICFIVSCVYVFRKCVQELRHVMSRVLCKANLSSSFTYAM